MHYTEIGRFRPILEAIFGTIRFRYIGSAAYSVPPAHPRTGRPVFSSSSMRTGFLSHTASTTNDFGAYLWWSKTGGLGWWWI